MAVIKIRKAKRQGARLVINIAGISGSGKTYSALQLAFGMANYDASKIGFIDTENKRGSLYANSLVHPTSGEIQEFYIGDLEPPFTPQRFSEAILEFQKLGVEVLVIDSTTHEYEGTGGVLEMREPLPGQTAKRDNVAKAEHKKFMNTMLQSSMHVINCVRSREKTNIKRVGNKIEYEDMGVLPVQEKNFMFEATASLQMWNEGKSQEVLKCPAELRPMLGRENGYITAADGAAIRAWVDGAEPVDPAVEAARSSLVVICEQGMDALVAAWKKLPKATREAISPDGKCPDELKRSAESFDAIRTASANPGLDDLNKEIMGGTPAAA